MVFQCVHRYIADDTRDLDASVSITERGKTMKYDYSVLPTVDATWLASGPVRYVNIYRARRGRRSTHIVGLPYYTRKEADKAFYANERPIYRIVVRVKL
jgi:hypothetical protein